MKIILFIFFIFFQMLPSFSNPVSDERLSCSPAPEFSKPRSMETLVPILKEQNIEILKANSVKTENIEKFLFELNKFPDPIMGEMLARKVRIRIMEGSGVGIDPELIELDDGNDPRQKGDSRQWVNIPGAGGLVDENFNIPTRIAINHLYQNHGASNLFLHEHAHTMDSLYGENGVSNSAQWRNLILRNQKVNSFTKQICGEYCLGREEERFAELFAYYHNCEATKNHLEREIPEVAKFFKNLTSIQSIIDKKN
jgi:hypothetical protein